jgi:hypothetical protein
MALELVEGETDRLEIPLLEDGNAFDATGLTVTDVLITSENGIAVNTAGKIGWATQGSGIVYFDPAATDLKAEFSPYRVRVKLTDGSAKVRFYPRGLKFATLEVGAQR